MAHQMETRIQTYQRHVWTEAEREYVRCHYGGTKPSAALIAQHLGVTQHAVMGQVQKLGLARRTARRWTTEEKERLRDLMGKYAPGTVAKKLNRSISSVVVMASRTGVSRHLREDWYTKQETSAILGQDHHWVQRLIDEGKLQAAYHYGADAPERGMRHIKRNALRRFIRMYPEELQGRNVDMVQLVEILAGILVPYTEN